MTIAPARAASGAYSFEMLPPAGWHPELIATRAREGTGLIELWAAIARHATYLEQSGELARKRRNAFAHRVRALVSGRLERGLERRVGALVELRGERDDPYRVAERVARPLETALSLEDLDAATGVKR